MHKSELDDTTRTLTAMPKAARASRPSLRSKSVAVIYLPHGNRDSGRSFQEILTASRICNTLRAPRTRDTLQGRAQSQVVA